MRRALLVLGLALTALAGSAQPAAAVPSISFTCTPGPASCKGWYRQPVTVKWQWLPSNATVLGGCNSNDPVDFDTPEAIRFCRVSDGVSVTVEVPLSVDMTPPAVTGATPGRPPDGNGWYRSPLQVAFSGTDALSGVVACTSATYGGPDGSATVAGTCTDRAGNVSAPGVFGLRYDATPPSITMVDAVAGDREARLRWKVSDAVAAEVWRSPGRKGAAQSLLARRVEGAVKDSGLRNGRRYEYSVSAVDDAGNATRRVFSVIPGRRLLAPGKRAEVNAAPLLRWTAVRKASYYNVQLFRRGRKILSAWPSRPRLQLEGSWRYGGRRYRLKPGKYTWLVWPGRGARSRNDYGPLIGRRSFTIAP